MAFLSARHGLFGEFVSETLGLTKLPPYLLNVLWCFPSRSPGRGSCSQCSVVPVAFGTKIEPRRITVCIFLPDFSWCNVANVLKFTLPGHPRCFPSSRTRRSSLCPLLHLISRTACSGGIPRPDVSLPLLVGAPFGSSSLNEVLTLYEQLFPVGYAWCNYQFYRLRLHNWVTCLFIFMGFVRLFIAMPILLSSVVTRHISRLVCLRVARIETVYGILRDMLLALGNQYHFFEQPLVHFGWIVAYCLGFQLAIYP